MRDSNDVSKIGLIFSALSKSASDGLVRPVCHFVQPCVMVIWFSHIKLHKQVFPYMAEKKMANAFMKKACDMEVAFFEGQ